MENNNFIVFNYVFTYILMILISIYLIFMSQIVFYFLHNTLKRTSYVDVFLVLTLSFGQLLLGPAKYIFLPSDYTI